MISLNKITLNKDCRILELTGNQVVTRRLINIGLIPNSIISKVLISPFGTISAYSIMGSTIAIRDKDVEGVIVEYV